MRLLVTGSAGQIGEALTATPHPAGVEILGFDRARLDITVRAAVDASLISTGPDLVVNAAAYTAVDKAESEPAAAFAANRDGPALLAAACAERGLSLLHISTDYVFDGTKAGPYTEDDPVNPLGIYGSSKAAGEQAVRERLDRHVILRTAWVYGTHGHNFVKTMLRLGRERDELGIVDDQRGCPTAASEIACAIVGIATQLAAGKADGFGTFHFCGAGATTWYGLARAIFEVAAAHGAKTPRVKSITTAEHPTPAPRPRNSVLDCHRIRRVYGVEPRPWRDCLVECIDELLVSGKERGAA